MKAMVLDRVYDLQREKRPLHLMELPIPEASRGEVLIKVDFCGVCHTELDEIEGRTAPSFYPIALGHQVVGRIHEIGEDSRKFRIGERVGVSWLYKSCGHCSYCLKGLENLCDQFMATGRDAHGGYAQYLVVPEKSAFRLPESIHGAGAAPLLCAGAVGYRSLKLAGLVDGESIGFSGFGASAHLLIQLIRFHYPSSRMYVFSRNPEERKFAVQLGAHWTGGFTDAPPEKMDKIIDTTPAWKPVIQSLSNLRKGGRLVINAIRKESSDQSFLSSLSYPEHLWLEKEIKTVANITASDVEEFLILAQRSDIRPSFQEYGLEEANEALMELKKGRIRGAKVLRITE